MKTQEYNITHLSLLWHTISWAWKMATWLLRPCRGGKGNKNFSNLTQRALKYLTKFKKPWWLIHTLIVWFLQHKEKTPYQRLINNKSMVSIWSRSKYLAPKNSCMFTSWSSFLKVFFNACNGANTNKLRYETKTFMWKEVIQWGLFLTSRLSSFLLCQKTQHFILVQ